VKTFNVNSQLVFPNTIPINRQTRINFSELLVGNQHLIVRKKELKRFLKR